MLADFCLRLAAGMTACLLLLSPATTARPAPGRKPLANPAYFRTHFLTALALLCGSLLWLFSGGDVVLLALLSVAMTLAFAGSVVWSLERSPFGVTLIVLTTAVLTAAVIVREVNAPAPPATAERLAGGLSSAALLGAALS